MKTAAKVFIIIGMICQCILIYPIILGIFALKALDNAETHDDLIAWGVVTLLFVNLLGGIFMLCTKDEELTQDKPFTERPIIKNSNKTQISNRNKPEPPTSPIKDGNENNNIEHSDFIKAELYNEL